MQFVEPSRQFVKDSIRLVKRCTKPDRKGRFTLCFSLHFTLNSSFHLISIHQPIWRWTEPMTQSSLKSLITALFQVLINQIFYLLSSRIPEDCHGHSDWVCHHGFHWLLRQTHSHPHQQHHCVSIRHIELIDLVTLREVTMDEDTGLCSCLFQEGII